MTTTNPHLLRKLGDIEHFSSSRHHLGIYRCVTVTARHQHPLTSSSHLASTSPSPSFLAALAHVVRSQPMLRVGIAADDSNAAHFTHIPSLDLRAHVSVTLVPCRSAREYEDRLAQQQGWEHDQKFTDIAERPPWRITILRPSCGEDVPELQGVEDIFFAFHHAIMDGTSGRLFHEMLLAAPSYQGSNTPAEVDPILSFPDPPSLPESQEQGIDFTLSWTYTLRTLWTELGPALLKPAKQPIWNAIPIDLSLPYSTRVKTIDYSPAQLSTLLAACRSHAVTLTALLHALVLASLAKRIPSAPAFAAATPLSLRPYLSPKKSDPAHASSLRCLVAGCSHEFPPEAVSALRAAAAADTDADVTALIWKNAQHVKAELAQKLARIPNDDVMGLLKYIGDWFAFWRGRDGKQRVDSWEISNIGVLKNPSSSSSSSSDAQEGTGAPRATRLLFTNGAMVAGPPMGINVASVAGGKFTIGLSWQDRVVEEELMEQLAEDLISFAARFEETGDSFV